MCPAELPTLKTGKRGEVLKAWSAATKQYRECAAGKAKLIECVK